MTVDDAEAARGSRRHPLISDVIAVMDQLYPSTAAMDWDVVGLAVGSRGVPVTKIFFTVDVTSSIVAEAVEANAELIIAHHPVLLRGISAVTDDHPKGRLVRELVRHDISVFVAHTNADVAVGGVASALADALELSGSRPMLPAALRLDKIITFVPNDHAEAVLDALATAGAGVLGDYDRCAFVTDGSGTFRPLAGSSPHLGAAGVIETVPERRIEMIMPRRARSAVVKALLNAHPYQTPAYDVIELAESPDPDVGLGRIGTLPGALTVGGLADRLVAVLPATAGGVRVGGDLDRAIRTVAVLPGSGDDLLETAHALGADAYVTCELRHHRASEALAWPHAPALIDISHWAAEWTWLPVVERLLRTELAAAGSDVDTAISLLCTDPWQDRR
jgi:dinuclear metal center YbgI/SA1388 family protein